MSAGPLVWLFLLLVFAAVMFAMDRVDENRKRTAAERQAEIRLAALRAKNRINAAFIAAWQALQAEADRRRERWPGGGDRP
jgi:biopolymer transport protein ExbB/TolQ